jgi:hypothetical protein
MNGVAVFGESGKHNNGYEHGVIMLQEDMRKLARFWREGWRDLGALCTEVVGGGLDNRSTPFFELKTWRDLGAVTEINVPLR